MLTLRNVNIAEGRSIAIDNARFAYIASADAEVEYPKKMARELGSHCQADPAVDVASGFWEPKSETRFEECIKNLFYSNRNLLNWSKFLPSDLWRLWRLIKRSRKSSADIPNGSRTV